MAVPESSNTPGLRARTAFFGFTTRDRAAIHRKKDVRSVLPQLSRGVHSALLIA
jgi:hypothetical protein